MTAPALPARPPARRDDGGGGGRCVALALAVAAAILATLLATLLALADGEPTRDPRPIQTPFAEWTAAARATYNSRVSALATWQATTPKASWPFPEELTPGTPSPTATASPVSTVTPTPAFQCRFLVSRCGTRAFLPFGRLRRR